MKSELQIISDITHNTRRLTNWYFRFLKEDQFFHRWQLGEKKINSPYWIMAHLASTQGSIINMMGGPAMPEDWPRDFTLGSQTTDWQEHWPDLEFVRQTFSAVHKAASKYILALGTEQLDLDFPNANYHRIFRTNRDALYHIIRHEGYHCGQIGLICKMHNIDTI